MNFYKIPGPGDNDGFRPMDLGTIGAAIDHILNAQDMRARQPTGVPGQAFKGQTQ